MKLFLPKQDKEGFNSPGQTMIETLVAIFMLTMGVSAAVGLAIFALNSSANISKQIIGTGLAREGLEAVKQMRDTNWLKDILSASCYDYTSTPVGQSTAKCYGDWLGENGNNTFYCIDPSTGQGNNCNGNSNNIAYYLGFDATSPQYWIFNKEDTNYGMDFNDPKSTNSWQTSGFYREDGTINCMNSKSDYCRRIFISWVSTPPYNQNTGVLLQVRSQVWWMDKKCPRVADWPLATPPCRLELVTYLTNWKNY
jgi:type II secretory pathway pseudopilin PulG